MHAPAVLDPPAAAPTFKEYSRPDHPIDDIVSSPFQTRQAFDETKLQELAKSIREAGVVQPLVLRIVAGSRYELVAGERRWRAAKLAGLTTVPVIVKPLTDIQAAKVVIIENDQREDTTALERAQGYARLQQLDASYRDRQKLADEIGKSLSWVHNAMKLLELHPVVQKVLVTGGITEWHAIAIARLQPEDQLRALKAVQLRDRMHHGVPGGSTMSVKALKEWIAQNVHMDLDKAPFPAGDDTLVPAAGSCGLCPKRAGANAELVEAKKANTCTDRSCYEAKTRAHAARRLELLSVDGPPAVRVVQCYYLDADEKKRLGHPLTNDDWKEAGSKVCPSTRQAVLLDQEIGGVKRELKVCTKPRDCSVHAERHQRQARTPSKAEKAEDTKRKKQEQARRLEGQVRRAVLVAVRNKVTELREDDLRLVARRFLHEMHADRQKAVYGWMDWDEPAKTKSAYRGAYVDYAKGAEQQLVKASAVELARFLVVAALSQDASVSLNPYFRLDKADLLYATAKRWKVDAPGIERDTRSAAAAVERAKAAKATAAKKSAKKVETSPRKKKR